MPDKEVTTENVVFQVLHLTKEINAKQLNLNTSNSRDNPGANEKEKKAGRSLDEEADLTLLRGRIVNLLTVGNSPVLKLLHKQVINVVIHQLDLDIVISNIVHEQPSILKGRTQGQPNDCDIIDGLESLESLIRKGGLYGLEDVLKEKVLQPMLIFCRHHEQVFQIWYRKILDDLLAGKIREQFLIDETKN